MDQYVEDNGGGKLIIEPRPNGKITLTLESQGWAQNEVNTSRLNMVDPDELIYAIMKACGQEKDCPGELVQEVADRINSGETTLSFEEAIGQRSNPDPSVDYHAMWWKAEKEREKAERERDEARAEEAEEAETGETPSRTATMHVHVKPVVDDNEWEETLAMVTSRWDRRLEVVQRALGMIPAPGKRGGIAAAFAGEEIEQTDRIEKALKIARFAADEDRDIPGVDR